MATRVRCACRSITTTATASGTNSRRRRCRRAPSLLPPARSPTRYLRVRTRHISIWTASISSCWTRRANPVTPRQGSRQAREACGAHRHSCRWPRDELLRRPASVVLRQRGQGDGERQAGLSDRLAHAGARGAGVERDRCGILRSAEPRSARHRRPGRTTDADDRRSRRSARRRPHGASSPGSSTACRITRRWRPSSTARASRWKDWRSPAPGSTANAVSFRRSCWRWEARPTFARC